MAKPWAEYLGVAEKHVAQIEREIDTMRIGYQGVKNITERETRRGLNEWLASAPKQIRVKANAFEMLAGHTPLQPAYDAVDNGFKHIQLLMQPKTLFRPAVENLAKAEQASIYAAQAVMRREAMDFLHDLDIAEPSMHSQIQAMEGMIEDNRFNIMGIMTRDARRIKEEMVRAVTAEEPVATVANAIRNWQINSSYFNSSTLSHPRGAVRALMYKGVEEAVAMGEMGVPEIGKQMWTILPKAVGHSARVDKALSYRLFDTDGLNRYFNAVSKKTAAVSDWKSLGLGFNTDEIYVPVFAEEVAEAKEWSKKKRRGLIEEDI